MIFTCWSVIQFNLLKNSTHQRLSKRNGCGNPSIIVLQIVLSFFSRSILATQTNPSLVLKKRYLHVEVLFASNCHKTQPTIDFQEKMVTEPPSIIVLQIFLSFFSRSIWATQTNLNLVLKNSIYMLAFRSLQSAIKLNPPMTFKKKWFWNSLQLLSSKLY